MVFRIMLVFAALFSSQVFAQADSSIFQGMKARSIGPAGMSGRISVIEAVVKDPNIIYVGAATGGIWKSVNGGVSWIPVFDDQLTSSIGAIAVSQTNPNIVWVGTGETNVRNSVGVGRGMFKSMDAGKTWANLGLEKTEKISKVVLHPNNDQVAYVAALGTTWNENSERGVYKTIDGGKSWTRILYIDQKTGAADLVMDPSNPNKLIVSMWEHRRWPWFFKSGGPGSGIYISTDGGEKWTKQTSKDGIPEGELGRSSFSFSQSKPNIVYALVEAQKSVLLRSEDGGYKWKAVNTQKEVNPRPFYFCDIEVNPKNENIVYRLQTTLDVSEDGGRSFSPLTPYENIHPDYHALWMHPNGEYLISGNDGGLAISYDRGKTWRFVQNLPVGQFYHVSYDMEYPYNIYGGLQDNGSWRGPSTSFKRDAIYNHSWEMVGFGDGFDTEPDPENSEYGYAMSQSGNLFYYNHKTAVQRYIQPTESAIKDRYNWNAGFAMDPFDSKTIYYGSQFLHKSTDKGNSWEIISPDLTTNDSSELKQQSENGGLTLDVSGAEMHCTILTIAPSSVKKGVIWVGTDDGNVQVTQDGGKSWSLVSKNNSISAPAGTWVPHVEASKFDAGTAYACFDDHQRSNWQTYIYVTRDYGKTWTNLATKEIDGFVHCIEEDPVIKDLLWLGTEYGLYTSFNGGNSWTKWRAGVPTVPVYDIITHRRENDLIIGTHGRGIYVIDDVTPLRKFSQEITRKPISLFEIQPGYQYNNVFYAGPNATGPGNAEFKGEQRAYGAIITYYINTPDSVRALEETPKENKLKIEILDKDSVIRVIKGSMKRGLNRANWDLGRGAFHELRSVDSLDLEKSGIFVSPGTYFVRIRYSGLEVRQSVEVRPDPRLVNNAEGRHETDELATKTGHLQETLSRVVKQIDATNGSIKTILDYAINLDTTKGNPLKRTAQDVQKKLSKLSDKIYKEFDKQGFDDNADMINVHLQSLLGAITSTFDAPTQANRLKYEVMKKTVQETVSEYNRLYDHNVADLEKKFFESGFNVFKVRDKLDVKE